MEIAWLILAASLTNGETQSLEWQEEAIANAEASAVRCNSVDDFVPLFRLAASREVSGSHTSEELSEVNENLFLKCPLNFLLALQAQSDATRASVLELYFGVRHPPWELGSELRKWQDHRDVGQFVRREFQGFLTAEEPSL